VRVRAMLASRLYMSLCKHGQIPSDSVLTGQIKL